MSIIKEIADAMPETHTSHKALVNDAHKRIMESMDNVGIERGISVREQQLELAAGALFVLLQDQKKLGTKDGYIGINTFIAKIKEKGSE